MIEDIQTILQSTTMVSSMATATIISMALSAFLYNGYYSKIWRAGAVILGFVLSVSMLLSGLGETVDLSLMITALMFAFASSMLGFILGVFIYKRAIKIAELKHGISCHLNNAKEELTEKIKGCDIRGCKAE
jgi:hypothetical protein